MYLVLEKVLLRIMEGDIMDFAENTPVQEEVAAKLKEAADQIDTHAENISKGIDNLGEDWVGESYTNFHTQCKEFEPSMQALSAVLRAYAYIFESNVEPASEVLESTVQSALG